MKLNKEDYCIYVRENKGRGFRKTNEEEASFFIPESKLKELKSIPFNKKTIGDSRPAYRAAVFLLHSCHLARYWSQDEYYAASSQRMRLICNDSRTWSKLWKTLEKHGIIECDRKALLGVRGFGFRISDEWEENGGWRKSGHFPDWPLLSDDRSQITGLELDLEAAKQTLWRLYQMRAVTPRVKRAKRKKGAVVRQGRLSYWNHETYEVALYRLENFTAHFAISKKGGRIFTDANQLPKELRSHLILFSEETAELDIRNCQPLILSTLAPNGSERDLYTALAESGEIYEKIGTAVAPAMSRDDFKAAFIGWLFGESELNNPLKLEIEKWFANNFPELLAVIRKYMERGPKVLPRELQRRESKCIWRAVEAAGIPFVSTHDGVRVRVSDLAKVRAILMESFNRQFGLSPTIVEVDVLKNLHEFERQREFLMNKKIALDVFQKQNGQIAGILREAEQIENEDHYSAVDFRYDAKRIGAILEGSNGLDAVGFPAGLILPCISALQILAAKVAKKQHGQHALPLDASKISNFANACRQLTMQADCHHSILNKLVLARIFFGKQPVLLRKENIEKEVAKAKELWGSPFGDLAEAVGFEVLKSLDELERREEAA